MLSPGEQRSHWTQGQGKEAYGKHQNLTMGEKEIRIDTDKDYLETRIRRLRCHGRQIICEELQDQDQRHRHEHQQVNARETDNSS